MTYIATDRSTQDGAPALLFEFKQGDITKRFTNVSLPLVRNAETWEPTPIGNGDFNHSGDISRDKINIDFPRQHEFASQFISYSPEQMTTLSIFRTHITDGDEEVYLHWKGRVTSGKSDGKKITLQCDPIFSSLKRYGLRARYQRNCRHILFGRGCNLDKDQFKTAGTVTAVVSETVTVTEAAGQASGYYNGGMLETSDGVFQYIVSHSGTQVVLLRPLKSLFDEFDANGTASVNLYPGCDRTTGTCDSKFDNVINHGGFKWIPNKNPIGGSSIV